jgi:hypothetical protein
MMEVVKEINEVQIAGEYDVIVVGGGIAGIASALAAKRNGCRVLLIEKTVFLGGLATAGFIAYFLPLCDGLGRKVSAGIAEELLHLSIRYGYNTLPPEWLEGRGTGEKRYSTVFSPCEFVYALDELVCAEGIELLFDTIFSRPLVEGDRCEAIIVETKSGRAGYKAKVFIDASGDADLFLRAGGRCAEEKNYLAYWYYRTDLDAMRRAIEKENVMYGISLEWRGSFREDGSYTLGEKEYSGTDAREITRFVLEGRRLLREEITRNRNNLGALIALPSMAQYRRTRRIEGMYVLKEEDALRHFDDSIGCAAHWLKRGLVYEIPFRALVGPGLANILAAGRIVSAKDDAWEVTRVIPACAVTGQAAGVAAAIAVRNGCRVQEISIGDLQGRLEDSGVILHYGS